MKFDEFLNLERKISVAFENLEDCVEEFGLKKEKMDFVLSILWSEYDNLLKKIENDLLEKED